MQNAIFKNTANLRAEFQKDNTPHILAIKANSLHLSVLFYSRGLWDNIQTKDGKRNKKVSLVCVSI